MTVFFSKTMELLLYILAFIVAVEKFTDSHFFEGYLLSLFLQFCPDINTLVLALLIFCSFI